MITRKTQYAWMGLGGLICLFGLVLACKLRDGNKANAQPETLPPPTLIEIDKTPSPPPMTSKPLPSSPWGTAKTITPTMPKATLEMPLPVLSGPRPLASPAPMPPPSAPMPSSTAMPPDPAPLLRATFNPNTPTPTETKSVNPPLPSVTPPSRPQHDPFILEKSHTKPPAAATKALPPDSPPRWNAPVAGEDPRSQPGEPPLAPAPGPVQLYHVHGKETLHDIARRTLGSSERWNDLHKLNPTLKPDEPLHSGTTVRLPADACVQADDVEPVKPLPTLRPKPPAPKAKVLPLTGTYQCSLDEKGRLTLPRAIRDQLGGNDTVLLSPGPDKCLWLTNHPHLERLSERLDQSQASEADVRVFKRLYFAQTEKLSVNSDGRVIIPERLGQFAGLHQEVVLVGIDDHFEVWDAGRWRSYTQQKSAGHSASLAEQE